MKDRTYVDRWEGQSTFRAHELFPELGLLGLECDPEHGGQGVDHVYIVISYEEFTGAGAASIPMAISVWPCMATPSLHDVGNDLKRRYLAPPIAETQTCSIAVTRPAQAPTSPRSAPGRAATATSASSMAANATT